MLAVPQPYAALIAVGARANWEFDRSDLPLDETCLGRQLARARIQAIEQLDVRRFRVTFDPIVIEAAA
jgi:hypothetical protein